MREQSLGLDHDAKPVLTPAQHAALVSAGVRREHPSGAVIYRQDDPADTVYLLVSGRVKALSVNADGTDRLLRVHLPGSLLGLTAIAPVPRRDATAVTMAACEFYALGRKDMLDLMRADPELGIRISQLLLARLRAFQYCVHEIFTNNVEQRVARALLRFSELEADPPDEGWTLRLTHEELAEIVAARRPTVTAVLNGFAASGILSLKRGCIVIREPDRLLSLLPDAKECHRSD